MTVVTGFTLSSALCGMAPNLPALICFRVLQGTTGGGLQPLSQAVMLEEFPVEERGKAMAFWSLGIIAALILGPTLGGWITDAYSWRWVFYINLPTGIVSLIMIFLFLSDPAYIRRPAARVDLTHAAGHGESRGAGSRLRSQEAWQPRFASHMDWLSRIETRQAILGLDGLDAALPWDFCEKRCEARAGSPSIDAGAAAEQR